MPPPSHHLEIAFALRPLPNSGHFLRMMREAMILVDNDIHARSVHQFRAAVSRVPQNIIVPGESSDGQWKKPITESARINKVVDIVSRTLDVSAQGVRTHRLAPPWL